MSNLIFIVEVRLKNDSMLPSFLLSQRNQGLLISKSFDLLAQWVAMAETEM